MKSGPSTESGHSVAKAKPKFRTVFSDEFKRAAVYQLRQREQSATALALELGIRRNQLYKWARQVDALGADEKLKTPGRPPQSDETEVARLRRQLARAEEELAILKKFDAYLTHLAK
jgi:transposase